MGAPFIVVSDEFSSENKISYSLNTVAEVKNSDKIFRYNSKNEVVNYDNYNFLSVTPGFRYKICLLRKLILNHPVDQSSN